MALDGVEKGKAAVILVCDHRGTGLERELSFLRDLGYRLERSENLRRSLQRLRDEPPALLLVDPLTSAGTIELSTLDRARRAEVVVPLLVLADRADPEAVLRVARSLQGEAWDVVWRGSPPEELKLRIDRLLEDAARLAEMNDLRHQASHDDRTDLLRPKSFEARLVEHFSAAQRHRFELALILIDLDRFGAINKQYDHTVGDAMITRVGEVIRTTLRTEDVAGRLGGDEFGVLLPYTGKIDAAQVVKRLREEIKRLTGGIEGLPQSIAVSASLGFETFDGHYVDSVETLRRHAERALRQAKQAGGDQGVYYRNSQPD